VAQTLHEKVGGDLFEIAPARPYSEDYDACVGEAAAEKRSKAKVELRAVLDQGDMSRHKVVFVGYPNWLQAVPRPVGTFLESYDWAGKTVMPFCTHGGGRLGQTPAELARLCRGAVIEDPLAVFKSGGGALAAEIDAWLGKANIKDG
jgi:flavodoxin